MVYALYGRAGSNLRPKSRRCAAVGHLRAKSRALRPGCAPKRRCGASTKRACGRRPRRQAACSFTVGMALPLVCRGRMHAARHVCFTIPFFGCDGVWSMRRGGIHAAREHCGCWAFVGCLLFVLPCRAGSNLRPKSRRCAAVDHLRAKSRALRPGCAPKRRCGASTKRACGRSPRRADTIFKNVQCAAGVNARPTERRKQAISP